MKKITTQPKQTLFDIAVKHYGTFEGVWKILEDNPHVAFDSYFYNTGLEILEHNPPHHMTDISMPLVADQTIVIDEKWQRREPSLIRKLRNYTPATGYTKSKPADYGYIFVIDNLADTDNGIVQIQAIDQQGEGALVSFDNQQTWYNAAFLRTSQSGCQKVIVRSMYPLQEIASPRNAFTLNIADLPDSLKKITLQDSHNQLTGNLTDLPWQIEVVNIQGQNTITGDVASLPPSVYEFILKGQNTTSGPIQNIPPGLLHYHNEGRNTTGGLINKGLIMVHYHNKGLNQVDSFDTNQVLINNRLRHFVSVPVRSGLNGKDVDFLLGVMANKPVRNAYIEITGANAAPSTAGLKAVDDLRQMYNCTVIHN